VNRSAHEVAITAASQLMFGQGPSAQPVSPVGAPVGSMYVRAPGSTGQIGIVGFRSDGDTGTSIYTMRSALGSAVWVAIVRVTPSAQVEGLNGR
jgi:hypothetical protein